MINLLPYNYKSELRAARTNVVLVRYIAILGCAIIVLGGLVFGTFFSLTGTKALADSNVAENQQRVGQYQSIKTQADAFKSDLSTAKYILDNSYSFAELTYKIADAIPRNVIIEELPLDPASFGNSITLNASAKTFSDATKLRDSLKRNDQLFTNVQVQNIKTGASDTGDDGYPVKVTLSVVINKKAAL